MPINRISPLDAKKQLATARELTSAGIEFVCVPVNDENRLDVRVLAMRTLDKMISELEGGDDDR